MPRTFFGQEMLGLLERYCVCTALARRMEAELRTYKVLAGPEATRLMKGRDRLSREAAILATKLRLTPQRRIMPLQVLRAMEREAGTEKALWDA